MKIPIGMITPSFGRMVDILAAIEYRRFFFSSYMRITRKLKLFYFPHSSDFELLPRAFQEDMHITESKLVARIYYVISKLVGANNVLSMSDYVDDAYRFYNSTHSPHLTNLIFDLNSSKLSLLKDLLKERQIDETRLILVYTRDSYYDFKYSTKFSQETIDKIGRAHV